MKSLASVRYLLRKLREEQSTSLQFELEHGDERKTISVDGPLVCEIRLDGSLRSLFRLSASGIEDLLL